MVVHEVFPKDEVLARKIEDSKHKNVRGLRKVEFDCCVRCLREDGRRASSDLTAFPYID